MSTESPILVFDGVCVLCSRSVRFVLRHDAQRRFRFATAQSETGRRLMIEHGIDPAQPASVLLVENGVGYTESEAAIRVLREFALGWRTLAAVLWIIPRPVRDAVYRYVAKRRYGWFGKTDVCYLPEPGESDRFLV
ncbi:MAG: thiol-disulfide oxidoreductase DCC family protein [Rudaea sp.]